MLQGLWIYKYLFKFLISILWGISDWKLKRLTLGVPIVVHWVKDPTLSLWGCRFHLQSFSVSSGSDVATSCGVVHRCGLDLVMLRLWCRPVAAALIWPQAWELPCATGATVKRKEKKKRLYMNCWEWTLGWQWLKQGQGWEPWRWRDVVRFWMYVSKKKFFFFPLQPNTVCFNADVSTLCCPPSACCIFLKIFSLLAQREKIPRFSIRQSSSPSKPFALTKCFNPRGHKI